THCSSTRQARSHWVTARRQLSYRCRVLTKKSWLKRPSCRRSRMKLLKDVPSWCWRRRSMDYVDKRLRHMKPTSFRSPHRLECPVSTSMDVKSERALPMQFKNILAHLEIT